MDDKLKKFLKKLNIENIDINLIKKSLSHPSYTRELNLEKSECYERLEFLGDAVLKLASSKYLYSKYTNVQEGVLTKIRGTLVSDATLSEFAIKLGFSDVILLSKAEDTNGGRKNKMILACAFESVLGAIFLTYGYEFCEKYLENIYTDKIEDIVKNLDKLNPKANLQELLQGCGRNLPEYKIISEEGPPHNRIFECEVFIEGVSYAISKASSKKDAEIQAARIAFEKLEKEIGKK